MSFIMNNNMQAQNVLAPSNLSPPTPNAIGNKSQNQQQQRPTNEQSTSSSHRGRFGKSKSRFKKEARTSGWPGSSTNPVLLASAVEDCPNNVANQVQNQTTSGSAPHRSGRSNRGGSAGSGKYRQRLQTSQLIDGMEGLDLDLIESIAPTDPNEKKSATGRKSKHLTASRKVNLTHLLNYGYDRKQHAGRYRNLSTGDNSGGSGFQPRPAYSYRDFGSTHKFNKQQFLQANCQFVVLDGHDYSIHKVNPDWPIDWDCIEEVKFKQIGSTETTCPICLESAIAAKITRCGHIYCWTCMLHYLSLSDENCRQCPICFEPVYRSDLRSVVSQSYPNHSSGEEIAMKLMIRKKGCVEVEPYRREVTQNYDQESCSSRQMIAEQTREHYESKANLIIIDPDTVIKKIIQREKDELAFKLELDRQEPEVCFIEQALEILGKRTLKLQKIDASRPRSRDQTSATPIVDESTKSYLFYQSSDGQHIYLNPFSTKILCHEYQSLENCPLELSAQILQMDWVSMSESWRKRFKYLEHLPLTCEFRLIEIDFEKSKLVSPETYAIYSNQIKSRAQEREKRRREERKREKIIEVEQNRKIYGIQPSLKINLDNIEQFPSVSDERYLGLTKIRNTGRESDADEASDGIDDESDLGIAQEVARAPAESIANPDSPNLESPDTATENQPCGSALSFRDIQLQEASIAAKELEAKKVWGATQKSSSGLSRAGTQAHQSSFAQLLINAKTSQKGWTRNTSHRQASVVSGSITSQAQQSSSTFAPDTSDNECEELRAPPSDFTISDFIDMNIVSGRRGRAKPNKNLNKKKEKAT